MLRLNFDHPGFWLMMAGKNAFLAVAAGAFAAHGLKGRVDEVALAAFQTGADYHLAHGLALLGIAVLLHLGVKRRLVKTAGWLFLAGMLLFSGSLYFLGLTESRALVLLTPLGGLCFLAGWLVLVFAGWSWMREDQLS